MKWLSTIWSHACHFVILRSDKLASLAAWLLTWAVFAGGSLFLSQDRSDGFIKNLLQTLLCKGTTFKVLAFHFVLNDLSGSFLDNWRFFRVSWLFLMLLSQINFVTHKNLNSWRYDLLDFRIPLHELKLLPFS
jgi:hypothetical protein